MTNPLSLDIIVETKRLIAIAKPTGLATQVPSGIDSAEFRVKRYLAANSPDGSRQRTYLGVPHRLDRATSGVLVFAKDRATAAALAQQFRQREVRKSYLALLHGQLLGGSGEWNDWMRKIPDEPRAEICRADADGAQLARLSWHVVCEIGELSLLEIELHTGRSHQIRLQASSRGLPVTGDRLYGSTQSFGPACVDPRDEAIGLHAERLELTDPESEQKVMLVAKVPSFWPPECNRQSGTWRIQ